MMTVLFITDGAISDPILQSQGLPLLEYVAHKNYKCIVYSLAPRALYFGEDLEFQNVAQKFPEIVFFKSTNNTSNKKLLFSWGVKIKSSIIDIKQIMNDHKIDIIHSRSLIPALFGYFFKLISWGKIKLVYDNRGVRIKEEIYKGHWKKYSLKVFSLYHLEKRLLKASDSIVVVSSYFKSYLIKTYNVKSFSKNKIYIIPNRTKIDNILPVDFYNRNSDVPVCVYSGSAALWQIPNEIKTAFENALKVFNNLNFLVLTYNVEMFKNIFSGSHGLNKFLTIKCVKTEQVFKELSKCHFGLLLRENNLINKVSSPLKFAEYLAAGLPVLLSQGVGDLEKIVKEYNVGVIVNDSDYISALKEIKTLIKDSDINSRCRKVAEKEFDLEISFAQYLNLYKNLFN